MKDAQKSIQIRDSPGEGKDSQHLGLELVLLVGAGGFELIVKDRFAKKNDDGSKALRS